MPPAGNPPNPDLIYDLLGGVFKPQLIRIAIQMDVFTPLASGPAMARHVAEACGCDQMGLQTLLDYLSALHLLERQGDRYALSVTAETFLVRGRSAYVGDLLVDYTDAALYDHIRDSLRSGQPQSLSENFVQDAWLESYRLTRIPQSLALWHAAGIPPDDERARQILDIACGCAIKSFALAQVSPSVQIICLDSPAVLEVARDLARRMGIVARVVWRPANLLTADLGVSKFDAALVGQITHYLTPEQNRDLFRRIHAALKPGGTLVIDCPMAGAAPEETTCFLTLFLWANGGGAAHAFAMYRAWLSDSGFQAVTPLSDRSLAAQK